MSFTQFFRILWARRSIVLLATLACFITAFLVAKILPVRYEASSRLMLNIVKPDPVTGEVLASNFARAYVQTQIELIKDYSIAGKVADAAGWQNSPQLAAEYRASGQSAKMDFRRWLAQKVIDGTSAGLITGSNIMEIRFSSTSPDTAAKLADLLRNAYVEATLSDKREAALRNAEWFRKQTEEISKQLATAEERKTSFERANGVVLVGEDIDADTAKLQSLAMANDSPAMVFSQGSSVMPPAPSSAQLTSLDLTISTAMQTLGPNHPDLQRLRDQRTELAKIVSREEVVMRSQMNAAKSGGSGGASVGSAYSAQQQRVLEKAGKVGEAKRLATDVAVLRDQFAKSSARVAELEQEGASNEAGMTVMGDAIAPDSPVFPKMTLITIGSLLFGFALGIMMALIVELLGRRVRGIEDLRLDGIPVIGAMGTDPAVKKVKTPMWRKLLRRPATA